MTRDGFVAYRHSIGRTIVRGVITNGTVLISEDEGLRGCSLRNIFSKLIWRVNTLDGGWCAVYDANGKLVHHHPYVKDRIPAEWQKYTEGSGEMSLEEMEAAMDRMLASA